MNPTESDNIKSVYFKFINYKLEQHAKEMIKARSKYRKSVKKSEKMMSIEKLLLDS